MKKAFPLTTLGSSLLLATAGLLPLVLLPLGENLLVDSKMLFLFVVATIVFGLWAASTVVRKTLQVTLSPFFFPLLLLAGSVLLSSFFQQIIPMNQLLGFGGVYLSFVVIALLGPTILPKNAHKLFLPILFIPTLLLALTAAAEVVGVGPSRIINMMLPFSFPSSPLFSLSGSPLIAAEFLSMVLGAVVVALVTSRSVAIKRPVLMIVGIAALVGVMINGQTVLQQKNSPYTTPFGVSWSITTDMLKSPLSAIIGVGPDNFSTAYLVFKPAWMNLTSAWNISYIQASNLYLSVFVTLGLVGLAAWIWLTFQVVKYFRKASPEAKPIAAVVLIALIIELLLPPNAIVLGIQALAIAFWVLAEKKTFKNIEMHTFTVHITESESEVQKVPRNSQFLVYVSTAVCVALLGLVIWGLGRYIIGQHFAFNAVVGSARKDALAVYTNQQQAVRAYPYSPAFHRNYSGTNMLIALNLSSRPNLTDQEKQQVVGLVQQAINEGKVATSIQPSYSLNWLNLARIYTNLVGTVQGADTWAMSAYAQAVTTAPTDPILHLEAGGLLYRLNQPQQAVQIFEQTVSLKPDWPNAYYNLGAAYKLNKEPEKAVAAYQQAITLLKDSPEEQKHVQSDLEQLQKEMAESKKVSPAAKKEVSEAESALLSPTASTGSAVSPAAQDALKNVDLNKAQ
jgi:hypothetical protein